MSLSFSTVHSFSLLSSISLYDIPQFVYPLVDRCLGCFQFKAITNKAAMNIHAHVFVWTYAFILLEKNFGMK